MSHSLQGDLAKYEKWLNEPGPGNSLVASSGPSRTRRGRSTNEQILTATEGQGTTSNIVIVVKPESRPSHTRWRWEKKKEIVTIIESHHANYANVTCHSYTRRIHPSIIYL